MGGTVLLWVWGFGSVTHIAALCRAACFGSHLFRTIQCHHHTCNISACQVFRLYYCGDRMFCQEPELHLSNLAPVLHKRKGKWAHHRDGDYELRNLSGWLAGTVKHQLAGSVVSTLFTFISSPSFLILMPVFTAGLFYYTSSSMLFWWIYQN